MNTWFVGIAGGLALALLALLAGRTLWLYYRLRGIRLVTCPESGRPVTVDLDAARAAVAAAAGHAAWRLDQCSRWPERRDCGQECLAEIESAPEECLVRTILARWYAGKRCVLCGRDVGEIRRLERHPAFMAPDGVTSEWKQVEPARLPEVLATHRPVCWTCHVTETFRRLFPELVTDRSGLRAAPALSSATADAEKRNSAPASPGR
jgi:hypothetical protein